MAEQAISERVRAFVAQQIDSVVQLEALLLLHAHPQKEFEPADVARELRIDAAWAEPQLLELCRKGLLKCNEASTRLFRYAPASPELDATVSDLAQAYATRRVTIISLIFSKPPNPIRSFAEAFRLRRDKPNG